MKERQLEDEGLCSCRWSREKSLTAAPTPGDDLGLKGELQGGVASS